MLKETSSGWIQIDPTEPKLWRLKVVFFSPNCYFFVHLSQLHQNEYSLIFYGTIDLQNRNFKRLIIADIDQLR